MSEQATASGHGMTDTCGCVPQPERACVPGLSSTAQRPPAVSLPATVTLRTGAVLVLLTDDPAGPRVLLTRRAPDLMDYPGQLVFPGERPTEPTTDRSPPRCARRRTPCSSTGDG